MNELALTLFSVTGISLVSLLGVVTLALKENKIKKLSVFFVSFAVGALLGDAFIHLIPELYEEGATQMSSLLIISGIILFLLLEKVLHWRHCHVTNTHDHIHPMVTSNLIGDAFHNFMDGLLIASAFVISPTVGIATSVAVVMHEIPQEIGDFGILIHGGLTVKKALMLNLFSAFTAFLGVAAFYLLGNFIENVEQILLPVTIGGFIYIAGSDLIPELKSEPDLKSSLLHFIPVLFGIGIMFALTFMEGVH